MNRLPSPFLSLCEAAGKYPTSSSLLIPLVLYFALLLPVGVCLRDQINADAVSYIRNAQYLVEGRLNDSVSGFWSPLISWCVALLVYFKIDGLYAARIVLAIWGALLVLACWVYMRTLTGCPVAFQILGLSLIAICSANWATRTITPDLLLSTCLMVYCALAASPRLLKKARLQILCGALGGISYLAKYYGLPFFLAHFSFAVGLRWTTERRVVSLRKTALAWGVGILTFVIVTGPWIALLSLKYGKFTFSTVGRIAHTLIGPAEAQHRHVYGGLRSPPPGRIYVWEVPDETLSYNHWSPFDTWHNFKHQIIYAAKTGERLLNDIAAFDLLRFSLPGAVLLLFITVPQSGLSSDAYKAIWTLGTAAIYAFGFILVYYEYRYIASFLWPVFCIFVFGVCLEFLRKVLAEFSMSRRAIFAVTALVFLSFAAYSAKQSAFNMRLCLTESFRGQIAYSGLSRTIAQELRTSGFQGPIAASDKDLGLYVSYHMNEPYLGVPETESVSETETALREYGAKIFLMEANWNLADIFRETTAWQLKQTIGKGSSTLYVYVPPA